MNIDEAAQRMLQHIKEGAKFFCGAYVTVEYHKPSGQYIRIYHWDNKKEQTFIGRIGQDDEFILKYYIKDALREKKKRGSSASLKVFLMLGLMQFGRF